MPDQLTSTGLQIKTVTEIVADLTVALQEIYGADINLDSNSPDGQLVNIFAQAGEDLRELLLMTYNTFTIDAAFGVYLDQRVAINGIARKAGTNTVTDVTVTTTGALNLVGLDALITNPAAVVFTVADADGVAYQLQTSTSIGGAGDHVLAFQAAEIGVVQPVPNTITVQITVVAGVSAVNNPDPATTIGTAEENDAELKIRQAKMFFLASTGPADSIEAALLAVPNVIDAFVAENDTDSPISGVPAYSVWCIVNGGTDAAVGTAIYSKKSPGCGMKGSTTYVVTRPNGTSFTAKFDRAIAERLYAEFTLTSRVPGITFDTTFIANALAAALIYKLNQDATIGDIIIAMFAIEPRAVLTAVGVGLNGMSYADIESPSDFQHYFHLAAGDIDITIP